MCCKLKLRGGPPFERSGGFTLIELLIAIALGAVVLGLLAFTFSTVSNVWTRQQHQHKKTEPQTALHRMADDLKQVTAHAYLPEGLLLEPEYEQSGEDILHFVRTSGIWRKGLPRVRFTEVAYTIQPGRKGELTLFRKERAVAGPGSMKGFQTNALCRKALKLEVDTFKNDEWKAAWTNRDGSFPEAIRIQLVTHLRKQYVTNHIYVSLPAGRAVHPSNTNGAAGDRLPER